VAISPRFAAKSFWNGAFATLTDGDTFMDELLDPTL
jgi:hypothetical protein